MSFPDKDVRTKCWSSRDIYWDCLDKHEDDQSKCSQQMKEFENSCPKQWVAHFVRKREYIKYQEKIQNEDPLEKLEKLKESFQREK